MDKFWNFSIFNIAWKNKYFSDRKKIMYIWESSSESNSEVFTHKNNRWNSDKGAPNFRAQVKSVPKIVKMNIFQKHKLNHTLVIYALDVAKARTLRKALPIGMATKTWRHHDFNN